MGEGESAVQSRSFQYSWTDRFSLMKQVKTEYIISLKSETLTDLMCIQLYSPRTLCFDPVNLLNCGTLLYRGSDVQVMSYMREVLLHVGSQRSKT